MADKSLGAAFVRGLAPSMSTKATAQVVASGGRLTDASWWGSLLGTSNWSGKSVTPDSTLQLGTANACIRLISETGSTLPLGLYRRGPDGVPVAATDHQLYYLLHSQPNARMTAAVFWQAFFASLLLWGNAYAEKRMSGDTITSLDFLRPDFITRRSLADGSVEYAYNEPGAGKVRSIPESRIWHVPAFTLDGIDGISPVRYGANLFGAAIAADQASADTFRNGLKSPGVLMIDGTIGPGQRDEVSQHVRRASDDGRVLVMERGVGFKPLSMNPNDAELLASRAWSVEEICRWFRVPPFMVGHSEKSTSWGTGIEQQMIGFVTFVLRPWAVRIEQSIRKDLLSPVDRLTYSAEFALEGLLRGDSAARASFYSAMVNNGVMTRDEVRRLENLGPMGGNAGVLTVQSAMLPIDKLGAGVDLPATQARDALKQWLGDLETRLGQPSP